MIASKIETFDMEAIFAGDGLSGEDRSRALASFAREKFSEAQEINRKAIGRAPDSESYVDGARSDALDRVKPDGTIAFEFELASDAVAYCYTMVLEHSPVLTGRYKVSHRIFADGVEVASPEKAASADEVIILSSVPYARKIEGGKKRKPQSPKAPKGVYEVVANMASRRFADSAKIRYTMRQPIGGGSMLDAWATRNASKAEGSAKQRSAYAKNTRQPAIVITFR